MKNQPVLRIIVLLIGLLASVFIMKAITMGLGVSAMGINQTLVGAPESMAIVVPFLVITLVNLVLAVLLLKNVIEPGNPLVQAG
jgi:hypothetical protein